MDKHTISGNTGLSGVAKFRGKDTLYGCIEIRVIKDKKGGMSAKFQGKFFHRGRT